MPKPLKEMVLVVREDPRGWLVEDGVVMGPFLSKQRAQELAEGMAEAIRAFGQPARVVVR